MAISYVYVEYQAAVYSTHVFHDHDQLAFMDGT